VTEGNFSTLLLPSPPPVNDCPRGLPDPPTGHPGGSLPEKTNKFFQKFNQTFSQKNVRFGGFFPCKRKTMGGKKQGKKNQCCGNL